VTQATTTLRFTPTAWTKLLFLRDRGETEVGGFGICPNQPLLVEDIELVRQFCTYTTVAFDDGAVADFFDEQVDAGHQPNQFARIWIHTHPGDCPLPSLTDEETLDRVFGKADWAVMFILACGGDCYTRLRFNGEPSAELLLDVEVDFSEPFEASDFDLWETQYHIRVKQTDPFRPERFIERDEWDADETQERGNAPIPYQDTYDAMFQQQEYELEHDYY